MAAKATKAHWRAIQTILLGILAVIAVTYFSQRSTAMDYAELILSDVRLYRHTPPPPTGLVAVAAIDDRSIRELGRWPWPRSVLARLVDALADYKAGVIGVDVLLSERDSADVERENIAAHLRAIGMSEKAIAETLGPSNDLELARALKAQGSTYLGYGFGVHTATNHLADVVDLSAYRTKFLEPLPVAYNLVRKGRAAEREKFNATAYLSPIPELNAAAAGVAYVDIDAEADGKVRAYPTVVNFKGRDCIPLFLAVADAYLHQARLTLSMDRDGVNEVAIGRETIPVDPSSKMIVHFRGKPGTMPHYSISDIIQHRIPRDRLEGKIVMVGLTATALGDRFVTPKGGDFPGIEIQATAVDNVLAGDFIHQSLATYAESRFAAWIMGFAISVAAGFLSATWGFVVAAMLVVGYLVYANWLLVANGTLIGIMLPLATVSATYLVVVTYRYVTEGLEKRHLRSWFEHYVDPDVIASLVDSGANLGLSGERRHLSILFADIVNFTSRAERLEPEALVAMLNTYMTTMTNLIFQCGGVVDKLMGDGIMAFWGAPAAIENPARDAINCALRMLDELNALAQRDPRFADVKIGVGVATGEAVVGNFGGEQRFDYSVIGDTVNLASRLEGLTRQFKVKLLVNRRTWEEAGAGYIAREIGMVRVKGKDQLVPVVDIAGRDGDGVDPIYYRRFREALDLLHHGHSPENDLRAMLAEQPSDQVITMCLERLQTAEGTPAREMVFEFDTK